MSFTRTSNQEASPHFSDTSAEILRTESMNHCIAKSNITAQVIEKTPRFLDYGGGSDVQNVGYVIRFNGRAVSVIAG